MMGEGFKKLLMEKKAKGKVLSPEMAEKKMEVIQELMDAMGEDMSGKIKGLKKVTVAAPDSKGLKEGLKKAEEVVEEMPEEESEESEESEDSEEMSKEDIKAKIAELKAKMAE